MKWIGVRSGSRAPIQELEAVEARRGLGLTGDHPHPPRQVTLVQWEHIEALGTLLGRPLLPNEMRRNIAVAGINLLSLKDRRFRLGARCWKPLAGTNPADAWKSTSTTAR